MLGIVFMILFKLLDLFTWALILSAIMSTLLAFNVLDSRNRLVWTISDFLYRVTDPVVGPVRRRLPSFGNVDLSPLVVLLIVNYAVRPLLGTLQYVIQTGDTSHLLI